MTAEIPTILDRSAFPASWNPAPDFKNASDVYIRILAHQNRTGRYGSSHANPTMSSLQQYQYREVRKVNPTTNKSIASIGSPKPRRSRKLQRNNLRSDGGRTLEAFQDQYNYGSLGRNDHHHHSVRNSLRDCEPAKSFLPIDSMKAMSLPHLAGSSISLKYLIDQYQSSQTVSGHSSVPSAIHI